jgi:hypothetical protein
MFPRCPDGGMVDATDLKSVDPSGRGGSSPPLGTTISSLRINASL